VWIQCHCFQPAAVSGGGGGWRASCYARFQPAERAHSSSSRIVKQLARVHTYPGVYTVSRLNISGHQVQWSVKSLATARRWPTSTDCKAPRYTFRCATLLGVLRVAQRGWRQKALHASSLRVVWRPTRVPAHAGGLLLLTSIACTPCITLWHSCVRKELAHGTGAPLTLSYAERVHVTVHNPRMCTARLRYAASLSSQKCRCFSWDQCLSNSGYTCQGCSSMPACPTLLCARNAYPQGCPWGHPNC
jgi:hypothetical protein